MSDNYLKYAQTNAAVFRLYEFGPAILAQRHAFPRTSLIGPGTTGAKLVLNKDNEDAMDELAEEEEEGGEE